MTNLSPTSLEDRQSIERQDMDMDMSASGPRSGASAAASTNLPVTFSLIEPRRTPLIHIPPRGKKRSDLTAAHSACPSSAGMDVVSLDGVEMVLGAIRLNLVDSKNMIQKVDLSPLAEAQISTALLTSRRNLLGQMHVRGPVMADEIRFTTFTPKPGVGAKDAVDMMEIQLTEKAMLQVALPRHLERQILAELLARREARLCEEKQIISRSRAENAPPVLQTPTL